MCVGETRSGPRKVHSLRQGIDRRLALGMCDDEENRFALLIALGASAAIPAGAEVRRLG